jgi:hypothetical protein
MMVSESYVTSAPSLRHLFFAGSVSAGADECAGGGQTDADTGTDGEAESHSTAAESNGRAAQSDRSTADGNRGSPDGSPGDRHAATNGGTGSDCHAAARA